MVDYGAIKGTNGAGFIIPGQVEGYKTFHSLVCHYFLWKIGRVQLAVMDRQPD